MYGKLLYVRNVLQLIHTRRNLEVSNSRECAIAVQGFHKMKEDSHARHH